MNHIRQPARDAKELIEILCLKKLIIALQDI